MENIPKETETIAAKRSVRLAEKLRHARQSITRSETWWNSGLMEIVLVAAVFFINFYSVSSYLGTAAIENTFYSGPIIPGLAKILEFFGVGLTYAFQLVNIVFILFLPITFYFFVKIVSGRKIIAFLAILISSLPFYPFAEVRVVSSLVGLDGAHISSLTIAMLGLLSLFKFIKQGGARSLVSASIFSSLVALMSPFGFSTFLIMASILTFSEMLLGSGRVKFFRFVTIMVFTCLLIAFWYNPHFAYWILTGTLGAEVRGTISKLLPISFFAIPALGAFGYLLFDRKPTLQPVFLASFFTISFSLISLVGDGVFPSHPSRYVSELGISLALMLSVVLVKTSESLKVFETNKFYLRFAIFLIYVGLSVAIILGSQRIAYNQNVLGAWTGVEKGTIWQEREKFGGISSLVGYVMTLAGVSVLFYISAKANKMVKI